MNWFEVDKQGLAKLLERKGKSFAIFELLSNAWDTNAKVVQINMTPVEGRPLVDVTVEDDDPDGFKNLAHAWTIFAESDKKGTATKRGRFNLGEKLVLALCEEAEIVSTTGAVRFDKDGRRTTRKRMSAGSVFLGRMKMTRDELDFVKEGIGVLIPPEGVATHFNGEVLRRPERLASFVVELPTEIADAEGNLRPSRRQTTVNVYDMKSLDGIPRIYEMGIPVMELPDFPWGVEVMQKIPLSFERDSVKPAYLRDLAAFVLNAMHERLPPEAAASPLVHAALESPGMNCDAAGAVVRGRYGEKHAIFDPSDQEANRRLVAKGYNLIPGNAFSKEAWRNVRLVAEPAGQLSPSPRSHSDDGPPAQDIPVQDWSPAMRLVARYTTDLSMELLKFHVDVAFEKGRGLSSWIACYGGRQLTFNFDRLGHGYFEDGITEQLNDLLIHEFAHEYGDHLSAEFDDAMSRLGAALWRLAMDRPAFFKRSP